MPTTKFAEIYDRAIFKFTDYSFLTTIDDIKEGVLQHYLMSSIVDFQNVCEVDITDYDLQSQQFRAQLTSEMIEILAVGVAYYWVSAQVYNSKLLRNKIYSSDYNTYSPANLLIEAQALQKTLREEQLGMIKTYSFRNANYGKLKV